MSVFRFKKFSIQQSHTALKVGTDAVLLGAWANLEQADRILDIGTGSGILALMAAQRNEEAMITAIEPHEGSYSDAKENFKASPWSDRLQLLPQKLQRYLETTPGNSFDFIISNPPFYKANEQIGSKARRQARQQSELEWLTLFEGARELLSDTGRLCIVIPQSARVELRKTAAQTGFFLQQETRVSSLSGKKVHRILMEWGRLEKKIESSSLTIMASSKANDYSPDYRALTKDFYLSFP